MRLTLRTLLAYLDDILDPADKEELSQKIESSEFAKDLVHQTRDSVRRLRLSAPQVIGTGMGMDPNSVAEYLDNVLPPEQVGDYERICLESPLHLAETAACHHVLTMVLGEPADVDPRARQRMYMIPAEARQLKRHRAEPAHTPVRAAAAPMAAVAPVAASSPAAHQPGAAFEIPEYLRTRSWWRSRGALAALALVLVAGVTLYLVSGFMGWIGESQSAAARTDDAPGQSNVAIPANAQEQSASRTDNGSVETVVPPIEPPVESGTTAAVGQRYAPTDETPMPLNAPPPPFTPDNTSPAAIASQAPTPSADSTEREDASGDHVSNAVEPREGTSAAPAANDGATVNVAPDSPIDSPPGSDPSAAIPPRSDVAAIAPTTEPLPDTDTAVAAGTQDDSAAVEDADPVAGVIDDIAAGPPELGTYLSGKTVLLRYDEPTGSWLRVEPRSAVVAGQRLLSLPEFRPKITLAAGVLLDVSGGTQMLMTSDNEAIGGSPTGAAGMPVIDVLYGRIILINTSNLENQVRLKLGPNTGDAKLARNATLAVEVEPQHVPGSDPRKTPAPVVVRLYAPDGGIVWKDASGEIAVDKASRWTVAEGAAPAVVADPTPPEWIDQEPVGQRSEQRFAAPRIEESLVSDRPAEIQLLEMFHGNGQRELKSLAAKSCIHVGQFEPFVDALRDSGQRSNWKAHIDTLRSAMARNSETAEQVWQALVSQRGKQAAGDLYPMLCGYSADQIGRTPDEMKLGALAQLINWLEEDSLDYRVLAVHNLAEITGKRLMSNPAASAADRKINVRNWRNRLDSGELQAVARP